MREFENSIIQKYCKLLARKHGIKDISRVRTIIERNYYTNDGSYTTTLSNPLRLVLEYCAPILMEFFKNSSPKQRKTKLKDESEKMKDILLKLHKLSPSFEEALNYLPNEVALELFEKENFTSLSQKEDFVRNVTKGYLPFYTLDEIVKVLEDFIIQLNKDSEFIIKTGYPHNVFYKRRFLDNFSRCYYTRYPGRIEFYNPLLSNSYPECWIDYSKLKFWDLISEMPSKISSTENFLLKYIWKGGSHEKAPIIEGLSLKKAEFLEKNRNIIFKYKLQVFNIILKSLRNKDESNLWENCLNIFLNTFGPQMCSSFLKIDLLYEYSEEKELEALLNIRDDEYPYKRVGRPYISGGIRHIFDAIEYFEKEIKIGTFSNTKAILNKLPEKVSLISYYQSVNQPWQKILDLALKTFLQLSEEENKFRKEFINRFERDLIESLKINVNIPIELKYLSKVSDFYNVIKLEDEIDSIEFRMTPIIHLTTSKKRQIQPILPFPTPLEATWYDVSIRFISYETVQIRASRASEGRDYAGMGFKNRRTGLPDLSWKALFEFASHQGEISFKDRDVDIQIKRNLKYYVYVIRQRFKALFGIIGDPFCYNRKKGSWKTKFSIIDDIQK